MIESILDAKLITPKEFKLYKLFASELGCEVFKELQEELFWEEPDESIMTAGILGFYDGRRSVLRNIKLVVEKVDTIIKKRLSESEHE